MDYRDTRGSVGNLADGAEVCPTESPLRRPARQQSTVYNLVVAMAVVALSTRLLFFGVAEAHPRSEPQSSDEGDLDGSDSMTSLSSYRSSGSSEHVAGIGGRHSESDHHNHHHHQNHQSGTAGGRSTAGGGSVRVRDHNQQSYHEDSNHVMTSGDPDEVDYDLGPCGSDNCTSREIKRRYRYASIRTDILRKLRLTSTPNITGRHLPAIPDLYSTISRMCRQKDVSCSSSVPVGNGADRKRDEQDGHHQNDEQETTDDYHATTVKVLLFPVYGGGHPNEPNVVRFNVQPDSINGEIMNVTLGIYLRRPSVPETTGRGTWFLAYKRHGDRGSERLLIHKRRLNLTGLGNNGFGGNDGDTDEWHQIRLPKSIVNQWLRDPDDNYGIEIQVADGRGFPLAIIEPRNEDEQPRKPYLEIHVRGGRPTPRSKRQLGDLDCDDLSLERRCCRYPLVVDFDSFGWDWVIVPRRYSAYYCSGECPFLYYQTQGHQHVRQQQAAESSAATGGPCCSPKRVSAISMLYYDEHMNIVHGRLPGMVVEQCGCS